MENNDVNQTGVNPQLLKSVRNFTGIEVVFAWICLVLGFLFCKAFPMVTYPLGSLAFVVILFVATIVVVKLKKTSFKPSICVVASFSLVLAVSLIFTENPAIQFFAYAFSLILYGYFLHLSFRNQTESGFNDFIFLDLVKASFAAPFLSFEDFFKGIFAVKKGKGKMFVKIIIGVAIAIVPTAIIITLLSYDDNFSKIINNIFEGWNIGKDLVCVIFGIPVGMCIYSIFISSVDGKTKDIMDSEKCHAIALKIKIAPISTILAATLPILVVYVIFFISQWQYYVSAFNGVLPEETIYSAYAREGFFQLCIVAFINFIIIIVISLFMRRKTEKPTLIQKILISVFSVFTLVLIATAISKMVLYIEAYGLTQKRVYATWLMMILSVIFVFVIVKQFLGNFKVVAISFIVFAILFAGLAFSNMDGIIANYNVDRFMAGETRQMDTVALRELGEAAIPAMVELAQYYDRMQGTNFVEFNEKRNDNNYAIDKNLVYEDLCSNIFDIARECKDKNSFWSFTIPGIKADNVLEETGVFDKLASENI